MSSHSFTRSNSSIFWETQIYLCPKDWIFASVFRIRSLIRSSAGHFQGSSQYSRSWIAVQVLAVPKAERKPGSSETSMDSFHLDHIRDFLLTLSAEELRWYKRGRLFFSPLHPFSPQFFPFSDQVSSLLPFDREYELHHRRPSAPRL